MTKVGEGQASIPEPIKEKHIKELDEHVQKFSDSLNQYNKSMSGEEQRHLEQVMDHQMSLIQSAIKELKGKGFHKEGERLEKDFSQYKKEQTEGNYTKLQYDLETLKEHK